MPLRWLAITVMRPAAEEASRVPALPLLSEKVDGVISAAASMMMIFLEWRFAVLLADLSPASAPPLHTA